MARVVLSLPSLVDVEVDLDPVPAVGDRVTVDGDALVVTTRRVVVATAYGTAVAGPLVLALTPELS